MRTYRPIKQEDPAREPDLLDQFIAMASRMRAMADDMEKLGLKVEASTHDNNEELVKLRQLRNLLKEI